MEWLEEGMRELEVAGSKPSGCEAREKMCDLRLRDVWLGAHPGLKDFFYFFWPGFVNFLKWIFRGSSISSRPYKSDL
jgi:hypothetical protein